MLDQHALRKRFHAEVVPPSVPEGPVISNVSTGTPSSTGTTISWDLDKPGDGLIEWGTTTEYELGASQFEAGFLTAHIQDNQPDPGDLPAGSTIYFRITSKDAAGNIGEHEGSFETDGVTPPPPDPGSGATQFGLGYVAQAKGNLEVHWPLGHGNPVACRFIASESGTPRTFRLQWKSELSQGYGGGNGGTFSVGIQTANAGGLPSGTWISRRQGWFPGIINSGTPVAITMNEDVTDTIAGQRYYAVIENTSSNQDNYGSWNCPYMVTGYQPRFPNGESVMMYKPGSSWVENTAHLPTFDIEYDSGGHDGVAGIQGRDSQYGHNVGIITSSSTCRWTFTYPAGYSSINVDALNAFFKRVSGTADVTTTVKVNSVTQETGTFLTSSDLGSGSKGWCRAVLSGTVTIDPGDFVEVLFASSSSYQMNGMLYGPTGSLAMRSWPYTEGNGVMIHRFYDGSSSTTLVDSAWDRHFGLGCYFEIA